MSTTHDKRMTGEPVDTDHPNLKGIEDLTAIIEFLTNHPELPKVSWLSVSLGSYWDGSTREDLERFAIAADAAGLEVKEDADSQRVKLHAMLPDGGRLSIEASLKSIGVLEPVAPVYRPILAQCPHCGGTKYAGDEVCGTCDGRGYLVPDAPLELHAEDFAPPVSADDPLPDF